MATYYDQLVAKGISKGLSPERAQAAADVKLQREGVSIMSMPPAAEAAAPPSRSALVAKGKAAGLPAERAEAAADAKLERDAQKEFAKGGDFSAAVQRARAVGAEPGARDVVAEVLGPKKPSLLPAVGSEGAEAVYAMPVTKPRPAAAARPEPLKPSPEAEARVAKMMEEANTLVPFESLPVEEQVYIEGLRRGESRERARAAQQQASAGTVALSTLLAPVVSPLATAAGMVASPLVGLGAYGLERMLPGRMTESERIARSPDQSEPVDNRPTAGTPTTFDAGEALKYLAATRSLPAPFVEGMARAPVSSPQLVPYANIPVEEKAPVSAAEAAEGRVRQPSQMDSAGATISEATEFSNEVARIAEGAGRVGRAVYDPLAALGRGYSEFARKNMVKGQPTLEMGRDPYAGLTPEQKQARIASAYVIPTEENVVRSDNARLVTGAPDRFVAVGPADDPFLKVASPEDAVLFNPQAFDKYAARFPEQARVAKEKAGVAVEADPKVSLPGTAPLPASLLVQAVRSGELPETVPFYVRNALQKGDAAERVKKFMADPVGFRKQAIDLSIAAGVLPPFEAFADIGLTPIEYEALRFAGDPIREYADGGALLTPNIGSDRVFQALKDRAEDPEKFKASVVADFEESP